MCKVCQLLFQRFEFSEFNSKVSKFDADLEVTGKIPPIVHTLGSEFNPQVSEVNRNVSECEW